MDTPAEGSEAAGRDSARITLALLAAVAVVAAVFQGRRGPDHIPIAW